MSTLERLERADPVTDPETLLSVPGAMDTFILAVKERRSGIVRTADDRAPIEVTPETKLDPSPREWNRGLMPALIAAAAVTVAIVGGVVLLSGGEDFDVGTSRDVVEEFVDRRGNGQLLSSLELATPEVVAAEWDFFGGLEVWNLRGEQVEPCEELSVGPGGEQRYLCVMLEENDFHTAAGIDPWTLKMTLIVEDGLIRGFNPSIAEWNSTISPFNSEFRAWLREAHPDAAEQAGAIPMSSSSFNAENATIALQYVDEFVAQSDEYPIGPEG